MIDRGIDPGDAAQISSILPSRVLCYLMSRSLRVVQVQLHFRNISVCSTILFGASISSPHSGEVSLPPS
uniref:Uncharacterized protein n=1 Tax=Amphimedon queenslandica TaxID=400682 RepID=A0A1X7SXU2_AMPQE